MAKGKIAAQCGHAVLGAYKVAAQQQSSQASRAEPFLGSGKFTPRACNQYHRRVVEPMHHWHPETCSAVAPGMYLEPWELSGQMKIALKVSSEEELGDFHTRAEKRDLSCYTASGALKLERVGL